MSRSDAPEPDTHALAQALLRLPPDAILARQLVARRKKGIQPAVRHRLSKTIEYNTWIQMKSRRFDQAHPCFKNYGGRGITVCERWMTLENVVADIRAEIGGAEKLGMGNTTLGERLKRGWSVERALTTPVEPRIMRAAA